MTRKPKHKIRLAGLAEIAARYGTTTQNVNQWRKAESFPRPVAELSCGRIWDWDEITGWQREHRPDLTEVN